MEEYQKKPGSYKTLKVYQKSECVFDITYYFVEHFLDRGHDRTVDQMQQAARSGKQNIVDGYSDAEGSSDSYHKLTVIAKGSLEELLEDYEDYLRVRQLERWGQQHPKYQACIPLFQKHNDSKWYRRQIEDRSDEDIANIAIIVIHQTLALLRGLIDRIDKKFLEEGGIKEQRFQARLKYRSNNQRVIRDSKEIKDSREVKDSRDFREISNDSHNPNNPNIPNDPNDPHNPNHHP